MTENEISRPIEIESIGEVETARDIVATAAEREALAARFDIRSVEAIAATVGLRRDSQRPAIHVQGRVVADVIQECVVTLAPVSIHIDEPFHIVFDIGASDDAAGEDGGVVHVDLEEEDVEPLIDDQIDIGEIVAGQIALAVPAHPRAEGAVFDIPDAKGAHSEMSDAADRALHLAPGRVRPFAGLDKRMKSQ